MIKNKWPISDDLGFRNSQKKVYLYRSMHRLVQSVLLAQLLARWLLVFSSVFKEIFFFDVIVPGLADGNDACVSPFPLRLRHPRDFNPNGIPRGNLVCRINLKHS